MKEAKTLTIDFKQVLCMKTFNQFVEEYQGKQELIVSKSKICKYFGISNPTLLKWMRAHGYGDLIRKNPNHPKKEPSPPPKLRKAPPPLSNKKNPQPNASKGSNDLPPEVIEYQKRVIKDAKIHQESGKKGTFRPTYTPETIKKELNL